VARESQLSHIHSLIPLGVTPTNPPKKSRWRKCFPFRIPILVQILQKPAVVIFLLHPITWEVSHLFPNNQTIYLIYEEESGERK